MKREQVAGLSPYLGPSSPQRSEPFAERLGVLFDAVHVDFGSVAHMTQVAVHPANHRLATVAELVMFLAL